MHASPPKPVVSNGQPDPLFLATLEAEDEANRAAAALERARRRRLDAERELQDAELSHYRAVGKATFARCKWICKGGRK